MKKMTFGWRSCLRLVGPEGTSVIASGEQFCENVKELVADSGDEREFQFRYVNQSEPASDPLIVHKRWHAPAYFIGGTLDKWAPKNLINEASRKVKDGVYMELKGRHFDFALNKKIKGDATSQVTLFFGKHLSMSSACVGEVQKGISSVAGNI